MSNRDPYLIKRINFRRVLVVTCISALLVVLILCAFMMESGLTLSFSSLAAIHRSHPSLVLIDLLPLFIFLFLYPMHRIMNLAIHEYEEKVKASGMLLQKNTTFARKLSEGENPEVYDEMMDTEMGKALRMIQLNIKSNRRKEREQSWIAEGKDIVSKILREQRDLDELSYQVIQALNEYIKATQGALYLFDEEEKTLTNRATYAYNRRKFLKQRMLLGEGLVGQCAYEMDFIYRTEIPEDYVSITSGILGDQKPSSILLVPLIANEELHGVVEFAFLGQRIPKLTIQFLLELGEIIARTLKNLKMNLRTQELLEESQLMTDELQKNELQLQENARSMKRTQDELESANVQLEKKIEEARIANDRIHLLLEHASEVISIYDDSLNLRYISPSVINIFGYSAEEMVAGKDLERMGKDDALKLRQGLEALKEHPEQTASLEYSFIRKNGERIFLRSLCQNMLADPAIKGFVLNTSDITESLQVEKEQRLTSRMQSLSENSLDLILRISSSGVIYYANPMVEDYTDIPPHQLINQNQGELDFRPEFREVLDDILSTIKQKAVKLNRQITLPLQMGEFKTERILNVDAIPEFQDKELETILIVGHDVTEAKRIEKQIQVQNRKVQDSINYAERIQSSVLPELRRIQRAFPKSFMLYRPRDVISGDFPWFFESRDAWYIAAVDCTGHGVPGALLSLVGLFLMNNLVALEPDISAGELCDALHQEVRKALKQDRDKPETRDGMDMAMCRFLKKEQRMEFAGAHRPLYQLSEGELTEYKGDRKAIGGLKHPKKPEKPFTNHQIAYQSGDKFFFFTDGLIDQMGGAEGLKYGSGRVKQNLLENAALTMHQFQEFFQKDFQDWMGSERQLDDLLLIGIER